MLIVRSVYKLCISTNFAAFCFAAFGCFHFSSLAGEIEIPDDFEFEYGYTVENPIKVGGLADSGRESNLVYLRKLIGINGESVEFKYGGMHQPRNPRGDWIPHGKLLHFYGVYYDGMEHWLGAGEWVELNFDRHAPYDASLNAPAGFKFLEE